MSCGVLSRLSAGCVAAALYAATIQGQSRQSISDESLRILALRATFSGMEVSLDRGKRIDNSSPAKPKPEELASRDALTDESVYPGAPTRAATLPCALGSSGRLPGG